MMGPPICAAELVLVVGAALSGVEKVRGVQIRVTEKLEIDCHENWLDPDLVTTLIWPPL